VKLSLLRGWQRANIRAEKALLRFAEVENLPKPRSYDVDTLRKWYIREHGGNNFFRGFDEVDWANADKDNSDLVAATTRSFDITTRVTAEKIVPFFFRAKLQKKVCNSRRLVRRVADCLRRSTFSAMKISVLFNGATELTRALRDG
jgi:hypothetical protein